MILLLRTKNTRNGHARRAYFVFNVNGEVLFAAKDDGTGFQATVPPGWHYMGVTDITVAVGEYNRMCRRHHAK